LRGRKKSNIKVDSVQVGMKRDMKAEGALRERQEAVSANKGIGAQTKQFTIFHLGAERQILSVGQSHAPTAIIKSEDSIH